MKREMGIRNVISSLIMIIIGVILIGNPNMLIDTLSWIIGCLLILAGIIGSIMSLKDNELNTVTLYFGIIMVIVGILLIVFPSIVNVMIRLIFGGWILFAGVERLTLAMTVKMFDSKSSNTFLITSLLMIVLGILVLINFYNLLGWLLVIYAALDIANYIYYTVKHITIEPKSNSVKKKSKNKKISKSIKDKKAIDADIEE
jgi:uncharacterized membrane protein HdeD (DUF308 family)